MEDKLQNKLFKKYPKIFRQKDLPMTDTCMCWGICCGKGWYWLIDNLCSAIQGYIDSNPHLNIQQVEAVQLKEKFGQMRLYFDGGGDHIGGMVSFAENLSYSICEECGSTDKVKQTSGWITSLCAKCMGKRKRAETLRRKKSATKAQ